MRVITAAAAAALLSGCCWTAKRSCFPPCPPPRTVPVEKACQLPPTLKLEKVTRMPCALPGGGAVRREAVIEMSTGPTPSSTSATPSWRSIMSDTRR